MERRKVQEVGGGTYTVSLPKEWARQTGSTTGATVYIDTNGDDQLVIEPEAPDDDVTSCIRLHVGDEPPVRLERTVRAAYAAGSEEIVLLAPNGFSREQRRAVRRATDAFVSVTLAAETETELVVKVLLDATEVSVYQSLRQLRYVALKMHREATAALTAGDDCDIGDRESEADRLYAMIDRHFGRGLTRLDEIDALGVSRIELFELRTVARELERVADTAESIAAVTGSVEGFPDSIPADEIRTLARGARQVVERATDVAVGDAPVGVANDALETRDEVRAAVESLDRELADAAGDYRLGGALNAIRRTIERGGNIAELGLRRKMRQGETVPAEDGAVLESN